mgnify:CR=1 FL=1
MLFRSPLSHMKRLVGNAEVTLRHVCSARLLVLSESRVVEPLRTRKEPEFSDKFILTMEDPAVVLPPPEVFREAEDIYLFKPSLVKEKCGHCEASGVVSCENCTGKGRLECHSCAGTGLCPVCHGAKTVECPKCSGAPSKKCDVCAGSGWVKRGLEMVRCASCLNGIVVCEECGGRAKLECPRCFGKGTCIICKGTGMLACVRCSSKGTYLCESCGGEGEWHTARVLKRSFRLREFAAAQRASDLPQDVSALVSRTLQTCLPTMETTCGASEKPQISIDDTEVREFCTASLAKLLAERDTKVSDSALRFSVHAVPVARIEYEFGGGRFSGYFVGQTKEFISHGEPLAHLYEQALAQHRVELEAGRPEKAIKALMPTMEMATADPRIRKVYGEALRYIIEAGRRRFEKAGLWAGAVVGLTAPSWLSLESHMWGSGVAVLSMFVPMIAARWLGLRTCLCNGALVGGLSAGAAAVLASAWSWFLSPAYAVPLGLLSVAAATAGTVVFTRRYLTSVSAVEENQVKLITSESDQD